MPIRIPRHFHQIWVGSPIPPQFLEFSETWRTKNPGWDLTFWTDETLPRLRNQALYDDAPNLVDSRLVPRFQSDLARYELLEQYGGIYVDSDFEALNPIEPWLDGIDLFAVAEKPGLIANGIMGGTAGHPFFTALIDNAATSVAERPGLDPWRTVGPEYLTRISDDRPGELTLLPTEQFYPYHHQDLDKNGDPPPFDRSIVAHHLWASARNQVSVVIPWKPGCPYREASFRWLCDRLGKEYPTWQVVPASDNGGEKWCKAEAIINGVRRSFGEIIVVSDGDVWAPDLPRAVETVRQGAPWAMPYSTLIRLNQEGSRRFMAGDEGTMTIRNTAEQPYQGVLGGGILVMRRRTALEIPPDTRFRGWGGEDEAWAFALNTLAGEVWRSNGNLFHLWHPPQKRINRSMGSIENSALCEQYRIAQGNRPMMTQLLAGKHLRTEWTFRHRRRGNQVTVKANSVKFLELANHPHWVLLDLDQDDPQSPSR